MLFRNIVQELFVEKIYKTMIIILIHILLSSMCITASRQGWPKSEHHKNIKNLNFQLKVRGSRRYVITQNTEQSLWRQFPVHIAH